MKLARAIEALLFSAHKPVSAKEIVDVLRRAGVEDEFSPNEFANVKPAEVAAAIEQLKIEYIQNEHGFQLIEKAEGWQLASEPKYARWVRELFPAPKPARLSSPARRSPLRSQIFSGVAGSPRDKASKSKGSTATFVRCPQIVMRSK